MLSGSSFDGCSFTVGPVASLRKAIDWRDARVAAGGNHDPLGLQNGSCDLDFAGAGEPRLPAKDLDPLVAVAGLLLGVVEIANHEIAVLGHLWPVRARFGHTRHTSRLRLRLSGAQQRLRRDARPVGALSTDQLTLAERDAQTLLS